MVDYLILGSGLSALSFAALMAKSGKKVKLLEAHQYPGGYGHTFSQGKKYRFNAQLHYVWNCGQGQPVYQILKKLGLHKEIEFIKLNPLGYDRMRMPGYELDIPYDYDLLGHRLCALFPRDKQNIQNFLTEIQLIGEAIVKFDSSKGALHMVSHLGTFSRLLKYHRATLQQVFDAFSLPLEAQTLLALQWVDFLLPPNKLSIIAWVALFTGYGRGAYYPAGHFEQVIGALEKIILDNGGEIFYESKVIDFLMEGKRVTGVVSDKMKTPFSQNQHHGKNIICNFDPKKAAEMIGMKKFSKRVRKLLNYEYSPSNFMAYCAVEGLDLRQLGFGGSNLFHSSEVDLNKSFHRMYQLGDYSEPSFAITTPSLHTKTPGSCPEGQQIIEFLTVADYHRFKDLRISSRQLYNQKKEEILDRIIDITEKNYIPNLRKHLVYKMTGSPTTSERFCGSPVGNSYGSNLTPENMGFSRLDHKSSLDNFFFCNASSGYAGFAGTFRTGARLYEVLSGDSAFA